MDRIEEIDACDLASEGLLYAAGRTAHPATAYHTVVLSAEGRPEVLELLHFEGTQRAGIAWKGGEWWLDASSVEEALQRWMEGEGRTSGSRSEASEEN